jgi:hypothetical protein
LASGMSVIDHPTMNIPTWPPFGSVLHFKRGSATF